MKCVGIRVLKAKLSEYLRLAKAGETILITERDEVVAELRPARRQPPPSPGLREALEAMAERGEATLRSTEVKTWPGLPPFSEKVKVSVQALLDGVREDRS